MKKNPVLLAVTILVLFCNFIQAQSFGTFASAVWITDCNQSNFYNTSGAAPHLIGPAGNVFESTHFGAHTQNSGTLILRGAQVKTFKVPALANVCSVRMYYRVYLQAGVPGAFNAIDLPHLEDCNVPSSTFPSGGPCVAGDQKWQRIIANGETTPYSPVNLTSYPAGNYVLEVYYDVSGSNTSTSLCNETVTLNNGGNNYKAFFFIQSPTLSSTNPSSCGGSQGSITIGGLFPGATYQLSYLDDGVLVGPSAYVANGAGQVIITGLNKGFYSSFALQHNGCTTNLNTGLILSDPIYVPTFNPIPPFCAGTTAPILPTTSNNGITGTWSPAVVDNQNSGNYTFTPAPNTCGFPITISITVIQRTTPTFSFGTSLSICAGGTVPTLPATSTNGIAGTWNPAVVDNQNSGTYTFTPNAGECANPTTLTVTIVPNITPTFSFGTTATICAGAGVPTLVNTSTNGITGTWNPAVVDNQNSGVYTFTPNAGQCGTTTTFTVTVNPNITPTFSFGNSLSICAGGSVPTLPTTSTNGITGTWNPATVDNQNSGTYTFTPTAGLCALPFTLTVTVNPNITPTFSFGTSLTICANGTVPTLVNTSTNGITGTWNPAVVDNQNSGVYTFTPDAGQCATTTTFTVTIVPNITPTFSFGTASTICAGGAVPTLVNTSTNGITGTWNPAVVDNQNSGTYTFTPNAGQCGTTTTFTLTVNPNIAPTFSFGSNISICAGGSVPTLPTTSTNGITGTWNPATVDNQNSGSYTFTPTAGLCALPFTLNVTVNSNITPTFSFGTSLSICANGTVPALVTTSTNGITGTWNPAVVDNQNSGTYTFTPDAGQCATTATFTVTIIPNITPTFSFGTTATICAGGAVPTLVNTSTNGITGTWNPATVDNQNSGTYTFTPNAGQCGTTTTFTLTVNPNVTPTFSFGTATTICAGGAVPALPTTSTNGITGTWSPSAVDNQNSGVYTFTPTAGLCATTTTFTVTVTANITPTFGFGTATTICAGGAVPTLVNTSTNGITGTWNPATIDNQNSGVYTFTPGAGQCATTATFTVTVNPNITPTFSFGTATTICEGGAVPTLVTTSANGITGTWSPAVVDNQNPGVYTFTPDAGLCATTTTFTVTINPNVTPTFSFGTSATICAGGSVPTLPTTSTNGVTGTWNPSVVDNQNSGVYTFTPAACANATTFTLTVTPNVTPTFSFGTSATICAGGSVPTLPTTSTNGINGTWNPAVVDDQNSGVYTFTPGAGPCATTTTFTVTVNPNITPTFSFGTSAIICAGATVPTLPTTSTNGITGTWSPSAVDNQNSGVYTFTPTAGLCATTTTYTVTVSTNIAPTFSFGTSLSICAGATVPALPGTSDNGITGSWSPSAVSNQNSGTYTFTPAAGQCAITATFTVTVTANTTPTFSFGTTLSICAGASVPALPNTSANGIIGTWSPSSVDDQNSGTYTFTPDPGPCATTTTFTVTVNPNVTPIFSFGTSTTICAGGSAPTLPNTSTNGITGTWSPSVIDNQNSATYTFTPAAGQCVTGGTTFTVTVTPNAVPVFSFGNSLTICSGETVPVLPTTSDNGIAGTWNPSVVSNTANGTYVFTGMAGQCVTPFTFTVTVNPIVKPTFSFGVFQSVCINSTVPVLAATSANGITGTWNPSVVSNQATGKYSFTPTAGQCADTTSFIYEVNPVPTVTVANTTVSDGDVLPIYSFNATPDATITWTNSNPSIGLQASGTGNLPSFTAVNKGGAPITATIGVTPVLGGCAGALQQYTITVNPLNKEVFVPNVFSPNGDGKNDVLFVYGNYIDKVEMRIFNQWGQQIAMINNRTQGWDGMHKGNPQPVGVYVYVLKAVLSDGRTVNLKGSFTLVR